MRRVEYTQDVQVCRKVPTCCRVQEKVQLPVVELRQEVGAYTECLEEEASKDEPQLSVGVLQPAAR